MTRVAIGELVTVRGGGTPRKSVAAFYDGGVPWVTPKDMKSRSISGSLITLTESGVAASPAKLIPANSVLVVVRSGVLKHTLPVGLTSVPVTVNQDMKALTPGPRLDANYLAYLIQARSVEVLSWVRATTADNFPIDKLLALEFDLPPIEEQRRIAAILDHADVLAARFQRRLVHLTHLDAAVYQTFIGQAEWPKRPIGDIATKVGSGATPRGGSKAYKDEGVALIRSMNVHDGRFSWKDLARLDAVQARGLDNVVVEEDDVLLNITGASVARVTRAPATVLPARVNQHVAIIRPRAATIAPRILEQHLMSPKVKRDLLRLAGAGATREAITKAEILKLVVPIPDSAAQDAYLAAATALDVQRERALAMAKSGSQLKSSLQAQAFSGRL